jgi:hypothetical protein
MRALSLTDDQLAEVPRRARQIEDDADQGALRMRSSMDATQPIRLPGAERFQGWYER